MKLEVIVQNGDEAKQAEELGADRLELVSAISEGGLTPSCGTIKQVLQSVSIPVQVMIRPHSFHYHYTTSDKAIIFEDIQALTDMGGHRIVFGVLNKDGTINETVLRELTERFPELDITFHKAFDEVPSQRDAYMTLAKYQTHVKRILTSGGKMLSADNLQDLLQMKHETGGPAIMPGGGLNTDNIAAIHRNVLADQYHFGKAVRVHDSFANSFDSERMARVKKAIST
ncbi:copper homeostasis protein CutC [Barrientosiimonas marina]|uniref:PF03932 family protein CutC n=1 Tax=Lentibacillus kimchii TaxID=1542911 RepID=A0ABW2UZE8_9BACI